MFDSKALSELKELARETYDRAIQYQTSGKYDDHPNFLTINWDTQSYISHITNIRVNDFTYKFVESSLSTFIEVAYKNITHPFYQMPFDSEAGDKWLGAVVAQRITIDEAVRHGVIQPDE